MIPNIRVFLLFISLGSINILEKFFHQSFCWHAGQFADISPFLHFLDSPSHNSMVLININPHLGFGVQRNCAVSECDCSKKCSLPAVKTWRGIFFLLPWKPCNFLFPFTKKKKKKSIPKQLIVVNCISILFLFLRYLFLSSKIDCCVLY